MFVSVIPVTWWTTSNKMTFVGPGWLMASFHIPFTNAIVIGLSTTQGKALSLG